RAGPCPDHHAGGARPDDGGEASRHRRQGAGMKVHGEHRTTIWPAPARDAVFVIDQRWLPHRLATARLADADAVATAIRDMWVRGAPLIGAAAAFGLALQTGHDGSDAALQAAAQRLQQTRPTAVNLAWAVRRMLARLLPLAPSQRRDAAWAEAERIAQEDVACNEAIGAHGAVLLASAAQRKSRRL